MTTPYQEKRWVYAGRVFHKGSLYQRFFEDCGKGEERIYKSTKASVVGGLYKVQVDDEGKIKLLMKYDGPSGHPLTNEWLAQDVEARGHKMIEDRERRDKDAASGVWTLEEINHAYRHARGKERAALLAFVVSRIMRD